ncbi:unnamed protein product [Closterium sp. Naga37s-1]|nr:unnamed protein product [Closterium sp. Naga37s-1]
MASKICTVRASDPSIEQRFNMLTGGAGLGMAAELLGGGKPPSAANRPSRGGTSGATCGVIQPGVIISGTGNGRLAGGSSSTVGGKASGGAVNNMTGLRSALEAVVEESGWETDSSASHGWEELERTCAALDSNNVQIDCIDITNMLEEGVAPADSDASSDDDNNEDRGTAGSSDDDSTNAAEECTPHFSTAANPAARPASRLSHTFTPINRPDVAAAAESPPPNLQRRSSFSGATKSVRLGNASENNHADRAAAQNSHGGKYIYSGKYYSGSHSQAQYHSNNSPRLKGSPARSSSEGYATHSGPLSGGAHSGSPLCGAPQSESPHSGPLRHGFGSTSSLNSSHSGSGSPICGAPRSESLPSGPHTGPHSGGPLRHGFGSTSSLNSSHSGSMELGSSYGSSFGGSSFGGSSGDLSSGSCGTGYGGAESKPSPCHVLLRQCSAGDVSPLVLHTPSVNVATAARLRPTSRSVCACELSSRTPPIFVLLAGLSFSDKPQQQQD